MCREFCRQMGLSLVCRMVQRLLWKCCGLCHDSPLPAFEHCRNWPRWEFYLSDGRRHNPLCYHLNRFVAARSTEPTIHRKVGSRPALSRCLQNKEGVGRQTVTAGNMIKLNATTRRLWGIDARETKQRCCDYQAA